MLRFLRLCPAPVRLSSILQPARTRINVVRMGSNEGLKISWYDLLGVTEKATGMEIEEAFHSQGFYIKKKLTSTDDLVGKTSEDEIDKILEQSVDYMEAYQILSHPSKRIDYDNRLRMYRRGDSDRKIRVPQKVAHVRKGAFIQLQKDETAAEPKKKTASEKADELINDFYSESPSHTPAYLKDKMEFNHNFEHNVKMETNSPEALQAKATLRQQLSDIETATRETRAANPVGSGAKALFQWSNRLLGGGVLFVICLIMYKRRKDRKATVENASDFDSAYAEQLHALAVQTTSTSDSDSDE